MQELAWHTISFYFETIYWQKSWCHKGFKCPAYRQLSANFMTVTTILFTHTTFLWATCCLICFITIVKLFLTLILTTIHTVYLIWKKGSRRVWSIVRGCLLLHCTWSNLWYIQRSVYAHSLICKSNIGLMRLNTVRYFCHFTRGCGGSILTRILTGPHLVTSYDTQGDAEDLFLPGSPRERTEYN
jgi:hypothetical protein